MKRICIFAVVNRTAVSGKILISKGAELLRVPADSLMYVSAEGNYSNVVTVDGMSHLVTFQLGMVEDAINDQLGDDGMRFLRLGRGLIINMDYIYFIDVTGQRLVLSDFRGHRFDLSASREVLAKLKAYVESLDGVNND